MSALADRIRGFIEAHADGSRDDATRDALLAELSAIQALQVEPYRRYLAAEARRPKAFARPALPTDVFRYARVASHALHEDVKTFRTSGTTADARGEHAFRDLSLYDQAARAAARYALFPEKNKLSLCILAPRENELPDSSLSYMLARFSEWFGSETHYAWREGQLDIDTLVRVLDHATQPIALLGTSFAFVHADAALGARQFRLPRGSRIMQTGGFKGRSRTFEPNEMLDLLAARYGIDRSFIVQEYGMTELSSQLYETPLRAACLGRAESPRRLWVPSWARAEPIDPETLEPTQGDAPGLLRIDDLANIDSVCAIQTSDLARRYEDGVIVLGRAPDAVARGCSLAVDQWLGTETDHA
ncbi:MAG TPA: acyl-protein synthetase [Polyangiales bacterium]|nr:acyl-protein synthetase [Polyangiales bacterium]